MNLTRMEQSFLLTSLLASMMLFCGGCNFGDGPPLGSVTGVVTLNGQPLANASVSFHPEFGRGSFGATDEDGRFQLQYTQGRNGAVLGSHKVTITTKVWAQPSRTVDTEATAAEKRNASRAGRSELLPAQYRIREQTVLTAEVESGSNECNFDLVTNSRKR